MAPFGTPGAVVARPPRAANSAPHTDRVDAPTSDHTSDVSPKTGRASADAGAVTPIWAAMRRGAGQHAGPVHDGCTSAEDPASTTRV